MLSPIAASSALTTGTITSQGIGSGLNVASIVSQLMVVQNQPVALLQSQEANNQATVSAFGSLSSALSQFQTALQGLNSTSQYENVTATVANSAVATATATSTAASGTYSLSVSQLAQSQTLVTAGQVSNTTSIGNGVISFDMGSITGGTLNSTTGQYSGASFTSAGGGVKTVTINSSNNSLTGIAAAINAANVGVTATLVNDGSNTPYRLSLTSNSTGAANNMSISVAGDTALGSLLNQNSGGTQELSQTLTGQNAQLTVNGIAVTSPSNTVSGVISGVSLNLASTNATTPTTITVAQNTSAAVSSVNAFVTAYNSIASTISAATAYNSSTSTAGPLQGQNSVLSIQSQIRNIMNSPVPGAPSTTSMLAQVGVSFQQDGTLSVNSTQLQAAVTANPNAVAGLFAATGSASDSLVQYTGTTSATQPGSYPVVISQLATHGTTTMSAAPASTTITAGLNDTLAMNLDGVSATVTLSPGTYTSATFASALQTAINGNSAFVTNGSTATVTQTNGIMSIASNRYGSTSVASVVGGNGEANLNGGSASIAATTTTGLDVAGTINGVVAAGSGQTLKGAAGDPSSGLAMLINGGAIGSRGIVNYTQGYANELNQLMTTVLSSTGQITSVTTGLNATITGENADIAKDQANAQTVQATYTAQFTALDVTMSQLTSTSSYLTQQLTALAAQTS